MKKNRLLEIIQEEIQNILTENVGGEFFKKYGKKAEPLTLKNRDKFIEALKNTPAFKLMMLPDELLNFANPRVRKPQKLTLNRWYVEFAGDKIKSFFGVSPYNKDYGSVYFLNGKAPKGGGEFTDDELVAIDPKVVPEKLFLIYKLDMEGKYRTSEYLAAVYAKTRNEAKEKSGFNSGWDNAEEVSMSEYKKTLKELEARLKDIQESLKRLKSPIK